MIAVSSLSQSAPNDLGKYRNTWMWSYDRFQVSTLTVSYPYSLDPIWFHTCPISRLDSSPFFYKQDVKLREDELLVQAAAGIHHSTGLLLLLLGWLGNFLRLIGWLALFLFSWGFRYHIGGSIVQIREVVFLRLCSQAVMQILFLLLQFL